MATNSPNQMLITGVMGANGSGKTTIIRRLIDRLLPNDAPAAIIVNETGEETYDEIQKERPNLYIEGIRGGCIGCTLSGPLINILKGIRRDMGPVPVFIEPSEMVVAWRFRSVLQMGLRDMKYDIGPLIALVDAPDFEMNWTERMDTVLNHVKESDLCAISRSDMVAPEEVKRIRTALALHHQRIITIGGSDGLEDIFALFEQNQGDRR